MCFTGRVLRRVRPVPVQDFRSGARSEAEAFPGALSRGSEPAQGRSRRLSPGGSAAERQQASHRFGEQEIFRAVYVKRLGYGT